MSRNHRALPFLLLFPLSFAACGSDAPQDADFAALSDATGRYCAVCSGGDYPRDECEFDFRWEGWVYTASTRRPAACLAKTVAWIECAARSSSCGGGDCPDPFEDDPDCEAADDAVYVHEPVPGTDALCDLDLACDPPGGPAEAARRRTECLAAWDVQRRILDHEVGGECVAAYEGLMACVAAADELSCDADPFVPTGPCPDELDRFATACEG
ncbi:MAG: hypothetical protein CMH59_15495 [Myxococcales bacterium]|nr:hypothetical protein [Myxococcales bacterium]HJK89826.1 hypothetical protein [Polyangiaceae bacterium LLY-WYZ-15_(1-7)]